MKCLKLRDTIDETGEVEWTYDTKFHFYIIPIYKTKTSLQNDKKNRTLYYRLDKDQYGMFCLELFEKNGTLKEISIPYYCGKWRPIKRNTALDISKIQGVPLFETNLWSTEGQGNKVAYPKKEDFFDQTQTFSVELEKSCLRIVLLEDNISCIVTFNDKLEFEFNKANELVAISLNGITEKEYALITNNLECKPIT